MSPTATHQLSEVLTRGVAEILPSAHTLADLMSQKKIRLYLGIDPTGALLTLGHSVVLRKLQQFAELGHQVILLIGNGTVRIGDPTGRDSTRPTLTDQEIQDNFKTWKEQSEKILDFSQIEVRYNGDWLDKLTYVDLVKLMAHTTVQQLMERDMFQDRLKKGLPIHGHEIIYPLLQGYDSVVMDVDLEIGGSDQTFNMMMGRQLQKAYHNREKWVLTTPIINGIDGRKMSKSFNNYIALTENPQDMYGKLMRIGDDLIIEYLTVLTDEPQADIDQMSAAIRAGHNPMEFKKKLAKTITTMYHTPEQARQAEKHFETTIQHKDFPEQMPSITVTNSPTTVLELVSQATADLSHSQLKRLVEQGGVYLNDQRLTDPHQQLAARSGDLLKVGKRLFFRIEVAES